MATILPMPAPRVDAAAATALLGAWLRRLRTAAAPMRPYSDPTLSSIAFGLLGFLVGTAAWMLMEVAVFAPERFVLDALIVAGTGALTGTVAGFLVLAIAAAIRASRAKPPAELADRPEPSPLAVIRPIAAQTLARLAELKRAA
ncbi:MAG: hypothetical protein AB7O45_04395 [Alphaproteobacteria bacterium]